ncbi:MAG: ribonuclease R [Lachnospiraceae bacterium]|nr:ribonuclease R [Lachnospiraceae bacterium]
MNQQKESVVSGTFCGTSRGYGFVTVPGRETDIFVPAAYTGSAMDGDRVEVLVIPGGYGVRTEAHVQRVLSRAVETVVGTYRRKGVHGVVVCDNRKLPDLVIEKAARGGAQDGHKVSVKITDYGDDRHKPRGKVTEILGHINDPGSDLVTVIRAMGLPEEFPKDVMHEAAQMPETVTRACAEEELARGREDLRGLACVTIDGEDAKDLDDAITLEKDGEIWHLGVHIADVSHYVREGSALDLDARERGTSVYLINKVIPMLPQALSNGICSLNAGTDRLALSCLMDVDARGNVVSHRICESLIRVDRRMSYTSVQKILDGDEAEQREYEELLPLFFRMQDLALVLEARRGERGAIGFDFPESEIVLNSQGEPVSIDAYRRTQAHLLIEDFMLLANETVAEEYYWMEAPFVYRSHETPDMGKMKQLASFLGSFGYTLHVGGDEVHPKELQALLERMEGKPEEGLLNRMILRSLKKARYTTENLGHFGLSTRYYCHFTSPIRRYPDLQIHRIIKENLRGGLSEERQEHYREILPAVAVHASAMERRADEAEREVIKLKQVEYMQKRLGEHFAGVISGVSNRGLFVELPNTVEGMIPVELLSGDYFLCDAEGCRMVGERTGIVYAIGQRVEVSVLSVNKIERTITFALEKSRNVEG